MTEQTQQQAPPQQATPANEGQDKTVAIVAHLTVIGFIIALVMNGNNKSSLGSFYIRQMLGIILTGIAVYIVGLITTFIFIGLLILPLGGLFIIVLWIVSLIGAVNGEEKPVFLLGKFYQKTFSGIK